MGEEGHCDARNYEIISTRFGISKNVEYFDIIVTYLYGWNKNKNLNHKKSKQANRVMSAEL